MISKFIDKLQSAKELGLIHHFIVNQTANFSPIYVSVFFLPDTSKSTKKSLKTHIETEYNAPTSLSLDNTYMVVMFLNNLDEY